MTGMDKLAWHTYCPPWDVFRGEKEILLQMLPPKVVRSATATPDWPTLPPLQSSVGDCTRYSTTDTEQVSSTTSPAVAEAREGSITGTMAGRAGGRKRRTQPVNAHVDNHQFMSSGICPVGHAVQPATCTAACAKEYSLTPNIPSTAIVCVAVAEPPLMYMESAGGLKVTVAVYWPAPEVVMGWKVMEAV